MSPKLEKLALELEDVAMLLASGGRKLFGCFELDPLNGSIRIGGFRRKKAIDFAAEDEAVGAE